MVSIVPNAWRLTSKTVRVHEQSAVKKVRGKSDQTGIVLADDKSTAGPSLSSELPMLTVNGQP